MVGTVEESIYISELVQGFEDCEKNFVGKDLEVKVNTLIYPLLYAYWPYEDCVTARLQNINEQSKCLGI